MDSINLSDYYKLLGNTILLKRSLLYNIKKQNEPFPSEVQIQTTNSCNASCQMCPRVHHQNKNHEIMSDALFKKIVEELKNENLGHVFLEFMCQNEPLTDKDLFKKIRYIKEIGRTGIITMVVTNGSLFTEEKIHELEQSGLDILNFSVDALTEETYKKIRHGLDFNIVLRNIDNVIQSNFNKSLLVSFVKQKSNIHEYKEFKKYWLKKGLPTLSFTICNRSGDITDFEKLSLPDPTSYIWYRWKSNLFKKMSKCCISLLAEFNILWNGDVILCSNDFGKKMILGNIKDSSIKDIWNGPQYQAIRNLHCKGEYQKISVCRECSLRARGYV